MGKAVKLSEILKQYKNKESKAINLKEMVGKEIEIIGYEIKYSKKYKTEFTIIKTRDGKKYITFSGVIKRQVQEYDSFIYDDGLICTVTERVNQHGTFYLCLE